MDNQAPMRVVATDEIRDGRRKYIIYIDYQEPCYWWTERPAKEVKAIIARRNEALKSSYNFNGSIHLD